MYRQQILRKGTSKTANLTLLVYKERFPTPLKILSNNVTFDDELPICATEIQKIVDLSKPRNSDFDADTDNETIIKSFTFSKASHCLETVRKYLMQQDVNDAVFSYQHKVEKEFFRVRS
ncbi:hypothetical protein TNCV_815281 [Trichonephila clavipes]|nr:hypothetical protein TNCV_815281 [Trichonephila clavipes]